MTWPATLVVGAPSTDVPIETVQESPDDHHAWDGNKEMSIPERPLRQSVIVTKSQMMRKEPENGQEVLHAGHV